jgi:hypothetical protein
MTKIIKYLSYFLLFVIAATLLLAVFTQTPIFKNWLKNKIIQLAEARLNGTIAIEALRGNLFSYFQIEGLSVKIAGDDFLSVRRAFISFNPYFFLNKKISLRQIILEAPEIYLTQIDSAHWNFHRLLKPAPKPALSDSAAACNWPVAAPNIVVADGAINVQTLGALPVTIPKTIQNLNLVFGLWLNEDETQLALEKLSFDARDPDLSLRTGETRFLLQRDHLKAEELEIQTGASKLSSNIDIKNFTDPQVDALIQGQPLSFTELRRALPKLQLYGDPKIMLKVRGGLSNLEIGFRLWMGDNNLDLAGNLQLKQPPYRYHLKGDVSHLNLADFTGDSTLASDLNFNFEIAGQEFELHNLSAALTLALDRSSAFGLRFEPLLGRCEIDSAQIKFTLQTGSRGAKAAAEGWANLAGDLPSYRFHADIHDFDISQFMDSSALHSDLNLRLDVDGQGMEAETLRGHFNLTLAPSSVNGVPIDSAYFQIHLQEKTLHLREVWLASPFANVTAAGEVAISANADPPSEPKENHLQVEAEFIDFSLLSQSLPLDSLTGRGRFHAQFDGPLDSLLATTAIELFELAGRDFAIGGLAARGTGVYSPAAVRFEVAGRLDTTAAFGLTDLRSDFNFSFADSAVHFRIAVHRLDDLSAAAAGELRWDDESMTVFLDALELSILNQQWQKTSDSTTLRIDHDGYTISELRLSSGEQSFFISGNMNLQKGNNLLLRLQNVDLAGYRAFSERDVNLNGRLNLNMRLAGNLAQPSIRADFQVANLEYYQVPFASFSGLLEFQNDSLSWRAALSKTVSDSTMETSGFIPMRLSFPRSGSVSDAPYEFRVLSDEQVEMRISAQNLDLSFLQLFATDVKNIKGKLAANIVLRNTLNDLRGVGPIRIFDGQFDIPTLGTQYRNANLVLLLQDQELIIKDFRLQSGGGELRLVDGGLALSEKSLEDFKARFRANNFRLMNDKRMQARVKGDLELSGSIRAPKFAGEITVTESRIYYPAWFEYEHLVELTSQPYFIISDDSTVFDNDGAMRFQKKRTAAEGDFTETEFYKRLRGELAIYFPRNTWIRGNDLNIEVEGELVAVKEGPEIVLFGNFLTIRGYYELLGNRFQIIQGEMVFHGEPEPNPEVKIEAVYAFQDPASEDRQRHEFKVTITGTLYTPEFKFTLDDQIAEQEDILSILLFGQRRSSLSVGQAYSASKETDLEDRATGLIAGQIIKQLSGRLGQTLKLDMIQIESGKDLTNSKVRIGKYVTPDVFVSVSQDFGNEGNRKVELEYELPKKLFFLNLLMQASVERRGATGLDIIWKIEW